jgi:uncharacterized protein
VSPSQQFGSRNPFGGFTLVCQAEFIMATSTVAASRVAKAVPVFSWSSATRWSSKPKPVAILIAGLTLFGFGDWLLIESRFGNSPWSVLAGGVDKHTNIGIGTVTIITSAVVLLLWIPLRQRPGLGTVANAIIIGSVVELLDRNVGAIDNFVGRCAMLGGGLVSVGIGGALYLSTQLGPGPRDGLMTSIGKRFHRPIAHVRLALEVTVLTLGWALGGRLGVGTFVFAFAIGHVLAFFVGVLHRFDRGSAASTIDV